MVASDFMVRCSSESLRWLGYMTAGAIGVNTLLMCLPYRGMTAAYDARLQVASNAFTLYFVAEAAIKIFVYGQGRLAEGWREYWRAREDYAWNRLDLIVTTADVGGQLAVLLVTTDSGANATAIRTLRVFRALRVLRAFKMAHIWSPLQHTLGTMYRASSAVSSLAVLILLFTLMFAILGKQLMGGRGLAHFDNALSGLLTVLVHRSHSARPPTAFSPPSDH
jgi:hypothetical protein